MSEVFIHVRHFTVCERSRRKEQLHVNTPHDCHNRSHATLCMSTNTFNGACIRQELERDGNSNGWKDPLLELTLGIFLWMQAHQLMVPKTTNKRAQMIFFVSYYQLVSS